MRKVKATEDLAMSTILGLIITVIVVIAIYIFVYRPLYEGVALGIEASEFCVKEKEVTGYFDSALMVDLDKIYYAAGLALYITPGGHGLTGLHAEKIYASIVDDKNNIVDLGYVGPIEGGDLGKEMPCVVTGSLGTSKKNKCSHYEGPVTRVIASAEQKAWCMIHIGATYGFNPMGVLLQVVEFFTEGDIISMCSVDRLRVQVFYPCEDSSTLVEGDCDGDDVEEVGWDHVFPIECEPAAVAHPCTIDKGTYAVQNMDKIRQINFPGLPLLQVGVRAGCAGVQTGCDVNVYFGKPVEDGADPEGCEDPGVAWGAPVTTFNNLDYEYIYSNPLSVSDYVEIDEESTYYKKWCLRVESTNCWINSIDVQSYKK